MVALASSFVLSSAFFAFTRSVLVCWACSNTLSTASLSFASSMDVLASVFSSFVSSSNKSMVALASSFTLVRSVFSSSTSISNNLIAPRLLFEKYNIAYSGLSSGLKVTVALGFNFLISLSIFSFSFLVSSFIFPTFILSFGFLITKRMSNFPSLYLSLINSLSILILISSPLRRRGLIYIVFPFK